MDEEEEGAEWALQDDAMGGRGRGKEDDSDDGGDDDGQGEEEEREEGPVLEGEEAAPAPVLVLPLFAMLTPQEQRRVFLPLPSERHRLIVVATNVAETSVTIPGIKVCVLP